MRLSTAAAAALSSLTLASARIVGISVPTTINPNNTFPLTLITEGYIQAVDDIAVTWGFDHAPGYPGTIGASRASAYLGPNASGTTENITIQASIPEFMNVGLYKDQDVILSAVVMDIYGASGTPTLEAWNATIRFGETTGGATVVKDTAWVLNVLGFKQGE